VRFSGAVGFGTESEGAPGVWSTSITERSYFGDVLSSAVRQDPPLSVPPEVSQNVSLQNRVSIVGDPYAHENYMHIRYVVLDGHRWAVSEVTIQRPRLILTVGGIWDGDTP
jgi:hypothetical protein